MYLLNVPQKYCIKFQNLKPTLIKDLGNFEPKIIYKNGPGEGGKPHVLRDDQQNDVQESESNYGMNIVCSDEISLDRNVPDVRPQE